MRRCRIVADAHNVMRRDAVCDVAAFRFITTNERTSQVHFLLHHHSRTVVVVGAWRLEPRERSAQDKEIVADNYFGSSKWGGFAGRSTVLVRALALRG